MPKSTEQLAEEFLAHVRVCDAEGGCQEWWIHGVGQGCAEGRTLRQDLEDRLEAEDPE